MKFNKALWVPVLATIVMLLVMVPFMALAANGEPLPGSITGVGTYTLYTTTVQSGAGTTYSASPYLYRGLDTSKVRDWNNVDIFATVDVTASGIITITPQFSPDQVNWSDAYWDSISGTTVTPIPYRLVINTDTTNHLRVPIVGEYMRLKMQRSDTTTPTIKATFRNN